MTSIENKEKEYISTQTKIPTGETGGTTVSMAKELTHSRTGMFLEASSRMGNVCMVSWTIRMEDPMRESSKMGLETESEECSTQMA